MTSQAAVQYVVLLMSLAGLAIFCSLVRNYQRDSFRQKAFAIRDQLFDYAAAEHIAFSDPAYYQLRLNINRVIQYSHRLNFGESLLPSILLLKREADPSRSFLAWKEAVDGLPEPVKTEITKIHVAFQEATIFYLISTTPLVWLCLIPFMLLHGIHKALATVVARAWVIEEEAMRDAEARLAQLA